MQDLIIRDPHLMRKRKHRIFMHLKAAKKNPTLPSSRTLCVALSINHRANYNGQKEAIDLFFAGRIDILVQIESNFVNSLTLTDLSALESRY